jgi:hypothetical protein
MTIPAKGSPPGHRGDPPLELSSLDGVDQANIPNEAPAQDKFRNQRAVAANNQAAGGLVRLQYLARRLHGLGERPLFHFLDEVERGAALCPHLERYAALPAAFIKVNGGDKFAPIVRVIDGGEP